MLRAGWSSTDITPPVGVDLSGFGGREGPSQGVHDRLHAKAICAADGERSVALITADIIGLDAGTVAEIRRAVATRIGPDAPELMVIGGASVYALALPRASRLYLTLVRAWIEGDTRFPAFDRALWRETSRVAHPADDRNGLAMDFLE